MFEQLEDDFFDQVYSKRASSKPEVGAHNIVELAIIPWPIERIAEHTDIAFFTHKEDGVVFDSAVIGYEGRECFLLTSQRASYMKPEVTIQCSSLVDVAIRQGIVGFVLGELGLEVGDLLWLHDDLPLPLDKPKIPSPMG